MSDENEIAEICRLARLISESYKQGVSVDAVMTAIEIYKLRAINVGFDNVCNSINQLPG